MRDEKIIAVDEKNYGKLIVIKDKLTENDYIIIYASIKF